MTMRVILTHENADFDAIASLLGAHKLFPEARPILPRRINRNVQAFLALYNSQLPFVDADTLPRGQHIHRVILVDTQTLVTVRGMGPEVDEVLIIDHHTPPETLPAHWRFQGQPIGATTTLLVESISARLIPLNGVEATLLLSGIYEDTGSLSYSATTARDLRAAAWLMGQGASLDIVMDFLQHPLTEGQKILYEALLEQSETLHFDGHPVVIAWARAGDLQEELSTLAHKLRELLDPSALFVLVQMDHNTQLVARSTSDDINVADIAAHFGGKGHDRAAAALVRDRDVEAVRDELRTLLATYVRARVAVRDLMSWGVRTVPPDMHIEVVAAQMQRTGHEGYPVVEGDRVVGLVTRNAVDRALRHAWQRQPVSQIMEAGEITVAPDDSSERVRDLMIQTGWGQIPVVTAGRITGVVTRTDLIRIPPSEVEQERQKIARQIAAAFPMPLLDLIKRAGAAAAELGDRLYFVGGLVRDLLLHFPIFDVDLVVEGDAIRLARNLVAQYGGEVRTHSRFGTAKWLLDAGVWAQVGAADTSGLPECIDLVTARTEFYDHPTALPLVERSSIKQDLHRRDFTINTLALRLDPGHWGELLDFYNGKADLEAGVIRVLHSLSFVDDPTRILRAARFEARLGFSLDERSERLIAEALPLLNRVTGGRIRHELELIFGEAAPEKALARLAELGALEHIEPALGGNGWLREHFVLLRETLDFAFWGLDADDRCFLHWALWLYVCDSALVGRLAQYFLMPRQLSDDLLRLKELQALPQAMQLLDRPSQLCALLEPFPGRLLALLWLTTPNAATRQRLQTYWSQWQHIQPELTGRDLRALGLPPGPRYTELLRQLRVARLDGEITSREEELQIVKRDA